MKTDSLAHLLALLHAHRLTVRTGKGQLYLNPEPPEAVRALLQHHGRTLYRVLSRWGDGFGMALLHAAHDLPAVPFSLGNGRVVTDAERFRAALLRDAEAGPDSPRGRAVEDDVCALLLEDLTAMLDRRADAA